MKYWLGSYHFGVLVYPKYGRNTLTLFEFEADALKRAKFDVYNSERVEVLSMDNEGNGAPIYRLETKKKLVRVKQ